MTVTPPIIGSRGSALALWQSNHVKALLGGTSKIIVIKTRGDQIQHLSLDKVEGKGFFTKEIEDALLSKEIDIAVHSFKDMPIEQPEGLAIVGIPPRAPCADIIVAAKSTVDANQKWGLPQGATVGTSSLRRKAHLLSIRPDLKMVDIRGNVPTRFDKVVSGELAAVVLAEAGLHRLGYFESSHPSQVTTRLERISLTDVCPAPAQGALAIQVRHEDRATSEVVSKLTHQPTAEAVEVERMLLSRFGGGCHLPLGAFCAQQEGNFSLHAVVASPTGDTRIEAEAQGDSPKDVVSQVHESLVKQGAEKYL